MPSPRCLLLELPAELRMEIFSYIYHRRVGCAHQLLVWRLVWIERYPASYCPTVLALLLTSKQLYSECLPLLYDNAVVDVSLRHDEPPPNIVRRHTNLGHIGSCETWTRLKHVRLSIAYHAGRYTTMRMATCRLNRLAYIFKHGTGLKTLSMELHDMNTTSMLWDRSAADAVVEAAMDLRAEKIVNVDRNESAKLAMSKEKWQALRNKACYATSNGYWDQAEIERRHLEG